MSRATASAAEVYATAASRRRAVVGWCLFDFANSSYATLIVTVAYSVYFRDVVVGAGDGRGDLFWGLANNVAMAVVALSSPVLGALADFSRRRKTFFVLATLLAVSGTAGLRFVGPGELARGFLLYVVATIGFEGGYVFYNAFLPEISNPRNVGRVSGWAWAVGFLGGLAALALCAPLITTELRDASGQLIPSAVRQRQLSFVVVATFYLVFSLPAFAWLRQGGTPPRSPSWAGYATAGLHRVRQTLSHLRDYRETGKFVLASLFFLDGIKTIIIFAAPYATVTFGFAPAEVTRLFFVLNLVAFPSTVLAGHLADIIGSKRTLVLLLWLWIAVVLTGMLAQSKAAFWIMACGAAVGMGSTQAVARSFMARITPVDREAEFFGFYALSSKAAAIFGPLIFGVVSVATGSQRWAVLSVLPLFVIALLFLRTIDEDAACRAAGRGGSG